MENEVEKNSKIPTLEDINAAIAAEQSVSFCILTVDTNPTVVCLDVRKNN